MKVRFMVQDTERRGKSQRGRRGRRRRMCSRFLLTVLLLSGSVSLKAQETFSDSSRLGNPAYLEERIKQISDADLFSALDLSGRPSDGWTELIMYVPDCLPARAAGIVIISGIQSCMISG